MANWLIRKKKKTSSIQISHEAKHCSLARKKKKQETVQKKQSEIQDKPEPTAFQNLRH